MQIYVIILILQIAAIIKLDFYAPFAFPLAAFWGRMSQIFAIENYEYIYTKESYSIHQKYWKGIVLIQHKKLIVGRLDSVIAGTVQITFHPPNNESQRNIINITSHFVAPWARGYGLAKAMIDQAKFVINSLKPYPFSYLSSF